ncbi:ABC transporter [Halobacteriales archaeon QS_4_69_31]|nr:MAG: ABC transporter [Halobacteriales archaeon QS_4_69_31]
MVDVRSVSVSYGDVSVLGDVSLSVDRGEFVGLVGPNGAGKTTLLGTINGVCDPDRGTVQVGGDPVGGLSARATSRRVATVPQDTTVSFDFTVEDIVEMGRTPYHGRFSGDPDAEVAVERALERTETAALRDRSVGSLSGGERQRVVLARALAQETPALLLDEPTASLDINHQVRTLDLVRELTREADKAALAAIHDLDLAARYCDRLAVLADGDVLAVGRPESVLTGDHLRTAFDTDATVLPDPVTGTPTVTPRPETGESDLSVHVAGAGFAPLDAATEAAARAEMEAADAVVLAGSVPPSVRALVRDHDAVVRVPAAPPTGESEGAGDRSPTGLDGASRADRENETGPGAAARADPERVVAAVRRVTRTAVEADD